LFLTIVLALLVLAVAYESAKRGMFPLKREANPVSPTPPAPAPLAIEPTPTPLPMHFPLTEDDDLQNSKRASSGLIEAFKACWPKTPVSDEVGGGAMTLTNVEKLFGKIKKREVLKESGEKIRGENDASRRLGLLFDTSIFPAAAAGSATADSTSEEEQTLRDLQVRAAGRLLHCENAEHCECLSSVGP
jgi:hypothetical protein